MRDIKKTAAKETRATHSLLITLGSVIIKLLNNSASHRDTKICRRVFVDFRRSYALAMLQLHTVSAAKEVASKTSAQVLLSILIAACKLLSCFL